MDYQEIERLAAGGESAMLELKTRFQPDPVGEELCGLLNSEGGHVLVGVKDDGEIVGQIVADKTLRKIGQMLREFEPAIGLAPIRVPLPDGGNREVVVLEASAPANLAPFTFKGRAYRRLGTETSRMPQQQYELSLLQRNNNVSYRWENQVAEGVRIEDLDEEEIRRTERLALGAGRTSETGGDSIPQILDKLDLRIGDELTHAAVVAFGRFEQLSHLRRNYPQCSLQMARFVGLDKNRFADRAEATGHIFDLLDRAMAFLRRHLPVAGRIQPGLFERQDEPLFPLEALREALVNALCHRDYTVAGGSVQVALFDDRLEIWSTGALPPQISLEDLKRPHRSYPRNPSLADLLFRRGLIEKWGRGTLRIVDLCVAAGHPQPEFLEESGTLVVRFLPSGYIAPSRVVSDLTDRQREILLLLARDQEKPLRQILRDLGREVSSRTIQNDLMHLRNLELIELIGRGRGAVYRHKEQVNDGEPEV